MSDSYRPQPFWLLKGAVLGATSGAAVAVLLLLSDVWGRVEEPDTAYIAERWSDAVYLGIVFGGFVGVLTGLLVGAVMAVLMNGHLPLAAQRRRALVLGAVLPPVALCAVATAFLGNLEIDSWSELRVFLVPGVIGGPLAWWATRFTMPATPVS